MAQQLRTSRLWNEQAFTAGGSITIDLPVTSDVESLMFYLSGTISITTAYTAVKSEGLAKLIKSVEVLKDGQSIALVNGELLTHGNYARHGGLIKINPGVTVGTHNCEIAGYLDFSHIGGLRPKDSILYTGDAKTLQARVTFGQLSDLFTGAGVATTALSLKTALRETKETGETDLPEARRLYRIVERTYASNTTDRIPLNVNGLLRGLVIRAESGGELSQSVVSRVRVLLGSEAVYDLPATLIEDMNIQDNGWDLPAGYYFVDFAPEPSGLAKFSDFLNLYGRNDAFLEIEAVGGTGNKVQILEHRFELLPEHAEYNRARKQG